MEKKTQIRVQVDVVVEIHGDHKEVPPEITQEHVLDKVLGAFNVISDGELLRPARVSVAVVADPSEGLDFIRPVACARATRVNDVPREKAVRAYKSSPEGWTLQVRAPFGIGRGYREGKDFIVASAECKEEDLVALRGAVDQLLHEEALRRAGTRYLCPTPATPTSFDALVEAVGGPERVAALEEELKEKYRVRLGEEPGVGECLESYASRWGVSIGSLVCGHSIVWAKLHDGAGVWVGNSFTSTPRRGVVPSKVHRVA